MCPFSLSDLHTIVHYPSMGHQVVHLSSSLDDPPLLVSNLPIHFFSSIFTFHTSIFTHTPFQLQNQHSTYYPNHLTDYISTPVSPEQASTLVHHPSMPVSLGLSYPTNLRFHPHQGLSCPSSLGFYHPTQSLDSDFVLPQQACESGIILGLVSRDIDVDVESFTFLFLFP